MTLCIAIAVLLTGVLAFGIYARWTWNSALREAEPWLDKKNHGEP
jgi:hypothetical protein